METRISDEIDPSYAATCSDVTLYSNSKGFFKGLCDDVLEITFVGDWMKTFEKAKGDAAKIEAVLGNKELMEGLTEVLTRIQPMFRGKDVKLSIEKRKAAQKAIEDGNLALAFGLASQAVLKATATGETETIDDGVSLALALWIRSEVLLKTDKAHAALEVKCETETIDDGVSLALALWIRSEVLLKTDKAHAALEDLKFALKERLPAKMRSEYYWRMGHCYKAIGEPSKAKVSYELAGRLIGNNEAAKAKLNEDIASIDYTSAKKTETNKIGKQTNLTGGAKQNMPALSKLVKVCEEQNKGRFVIASENIKTGDVLLVERPYASCLLTDYFGSHCLHCYKRLDLCEEAAPIWCTKCSGVAFCSSSCQTSATTTYHKYECQLMDILIGSGMSILSHIALRMVTQLGLESCISVHSKYITNEMQTIECAAVNDIEGIAKKTRIKTRKERLNRTKKGLKGFDKITKEDDIKESSSDDKFNFEESLEMKAAQIYSLCTHSEQRTPDDYLKRIVMAMFLTECLKKSDFFGKCDNELLRKHEMVITKLILRNLQLLQFNAHEIYETLRGNHQFSGSKPLYIAVGLYATGALFNHECYPAVARYFEGRNIVLRATRPLPPGEMVAENYGPHFLVRPLDERQRSLACRYWFRCQCVACKQDWPMLKQMNANSSVALRCPNKKCCSKLRFDKQCPAACNECGTVLDQKIMSQNIEKIKKCLTLYQEGAKQMDKEDPLKAIELFTQAVDDFHEVAWPPNRETHLVQESLRSCYAAFANVHRVNEINKTETKTK